MHTCKCGKETCKCASRLYFFLTCEQIGGQWYLSSRKAFQRIAGNDSNVDLQILDNYSNEYKYPRRHGAAVSTETPIQVYFDQYHANISLDFVPSLPCPWPKEARGWLTRGKHDWPALSLRKEIVQDGCLLVPKPHLNSVNKNTLWRYSFSKAENALALDLPNHVKAVFKMIKAILGTELEGCSALSTYHFKTLLFWSCEKLPSRKLKSNSMGQFILHMLDNAIHSIARGYLPNYFIPSCNLFDNCSKRHMRDAAKHLCKMRKNIVSAMKHFYDTYCTMLSMFTDSRPMRHYLPMLIQLAELNEDHKMKIYIFDDIDSSVLLFLLKLLSQSCTEANYDQINKDLMIDRRMKLRRLTSIKTTHSSASYTLDENLDLLIKLMKPHIENKKHAKYFDDGKYVVADKDADVAGEDDDDSGDDTEDNRSCKPEVASPSTEYGKTATRSKESHVSVEEELVMQASYLVSIGEYKKATEVLEKVYHRSPSQDSSLVPDPNVGHIPYALLINYYDKRVKKNEARRLLVEFEQYLFNTS